MLADTLCAAINAHDLDAFVACFDDDYESAQRAHPGREFRGSDQVRKNWTAFFREVPDIRAEVLATTEDDGVEFSEVHWSGTRLDGSVFEARGMTIAGTQNGRIGWQRLYIEEVEHATEGIDAAVQQLTHTSEAAEEQTQTTHMSAD